MELTHLQFEDDTLILLPKNTKKLLNYRRLLQCFGIMSGLYVSFNKSTLVGWGVNDQWISEMSIEMNCKSEKLPSHIWVYLWELVVKLQDSRLPYLTELKLH